MKGDLVTLRKVCTYGSKTMMIGGIVIVALLLAMTVLGIGSLFSEQMSGILKDLTGSDVKNIDVLLTCIILAMGAVTVFAVYRLMCSIRDEPSPFTPGNTLLFKRLSQLYTVCSVILGSIELFGGNGVFPALFMFFGCLLIGTVMYCFALIVRYGYVLQSESDRTL